MNKRVNIPNSLRDEILITNQHACCVCHNGGVQIHHIDGNNNNNTYENLAVLCLEHHDKATAPRSLTASLTQNQIRTYKRIWENQCKELTHDIARSRTAFFMVDYKNVERIRDLFSQLSGEDFIQDYKRLRDQLVSEKQLRIEQKFDVSIEPTTYLYPITAALLEEIKMGNVHPGWFKDCKGHSFDPLYPTMNWSIKPPPKYAYDIWCQLMVRAIIIIRTTYDLFSLMRIEDPESLKLCGQLISFEGNLKGKVHFPNEWDKYPISNTVFTSENENAIWESEFSIKTQYIYSKTASVSLGKNHANGICVLRSIDEIDKSNSKIKVKFSCTPIIIGYGVLQIS